MPNPTAPCTAQAIATTTLATPNVSTDGHVPEALACESWNRRGKPLRDYRISWREPSFSGGGAVINVGVLTPRAAAGAEVELPQMAAGLVSARVSRVITAGSDQDEAPPASPRGLRAQSNQVLLWSILIEAGASLEVRGFGRLFS